MKKYIQPQTDEQFVYRLMLLDSPSDENGYNLTQSIGAPVGPATE